MYKKEYSKQWRDKNKDKIKEYNRVWNLLNPEKRKLADLNYQKNNKVKLAVKGKEYYYANLELRRNYFRRDKGLYSTFRNMLVRCRYKSHSSYNHYGGRGIKVEWNSYEEFKKDMYESYLKHIKKYGRKNTSIDRIDNDGNYCKENCRWATMKIQQNNRSNNKPPKK